MHVTWKNAQYGISPHPFKNQYNIFLVEVVSDLAYEFCCCVDILLNHVLTKYGHLVQWHRNYFLGGFQRMVHCRRSKQSWDLVQWHCDCLFCVSQMTEHHQTQPKYEPLVKWYYNYYFWRFQTNEHRYQKKYLKSTCPLSMGWMQIFFKWCQKIYLLEKILF